MNWTACVDSDLQTTLERRGLSIRYVVDSAADRLILEEDIADALDGIDHIELLLAANDNSGRPHGRIFMAV